MTEYFDGFDNDGDTGNSSIFQARIREEDLTSAQKIDEIARAADELVRKALLQNQSYEQINQQIHTKLDGLLCRIESYVEESDSSDAEGVLQIIYKMIKNFFDALGISVKGQNFKMKLLKKAKDKSWLASIIKELCDKLRKLLGKIFKQDLGWEEALEKEIKELQEKLDSGDLSQEETVAALERLEVLRTMKLKFQMAFMSFVLTSFFTLLEIELGAAIAQETSTEENKKTESKEPEVKQAKENAAGEGEVKVTEKNKKDVQPKNLESPPTNSREIKDGKEKPIIPPLKLEIDPLLSEFLKHNILEPVKPVESKQQAQEKPKQADPAPALPQPPAPAKVPEMQPVQSPSTTSGLSNKENRDYGSALKSIRKEKAQTTKSTNEQEIDNLCAEFLTQITCAEGKPDISMQDFAKSDLTNEKVRSELNAIKEVESAVDVNCGRGI